MIKGFYTQHKDTGKWHQIEDVKDTGKPAHEQGGGNMVKLKGVDGWVHPSKLQGMQASIPLKKADKIPGGLADGMKPSEFDQDDLKVGIAVEMEHTTDKSIATEIAMDHLKENANYYKDWQNKEKILFQEKAPKIEKSEDIDPLELETGADIEMRLKGITNPDAAKDLAMYFLNGDPDYYKRLREELMGKDETPLKNRWNVLKKALDADRSLINLEEEESKDSPQDDKLTPDLQQEDNKPSDEQVADMLRQEGYEDQEIAFILGGHTPPAATPDDIAMNHDQNMNSLELQQEQQRADPEDEKAHEKRMRDNQHEIAKKDLDQKNLEIEHKKKLQELEIASKKKELDREDPTNDIKRKQAELELDHKARLLEIEYKKAKKEADKEDPTDEMKEKQLKFELEMKRKQIELELKYKEKELQLNLQLKAEAAKIKSQQQEESMAAAHKEKMKAKSEQPVDNKEEKAKEML